MAGYIAYWNGKKFRIPAKGELCGSFHSPEIGREITDPDEIRIAVLATTSINYWLKCIRMTMIPIFTSKQLRLIPTP